MSISFRPGNDCPTPFDAGQSSCPNSAPPFGSISTSILNAYERPSMRIHAVSRAFGLRPIRVYPILRAHDKALGNSANHNSTIPQFPPSPSLDVDISPDLFSSGRLLLPWYLFYWRVFYPFADSLLAACAASVRVWRQSRKARRDADEAYHDLCTDAWIR